MEMFVTFRQIGRVDVETIFHCSPSAAGKAINALHGDKLIFIDQWRKPEGQGQHAPMYALRIDDEEDAPRPITHSRKPGSVGGRRRRGVVPEHVSQAAKGRELLGPWGGLVPLSQL